MKKFTCTALFYSMTQQAKRSIGMACCMLLITCTIGCSSSHHTSGHYHSVHSFQGTHDAYGHHDGHLYHGTALEFLVFEAIVLGVILIVPPVIDAIGEVLDEICVGIGLKNHKTTD